MSPDLDWLVGHAVTRVNHDDETQRWLLVLSDDIQMSLACPWQIIAEGRVSLASGDHGQQYGLPEPIDAPARAMELLAGRAIRQVSLEQASADLCIEFEGAVRMRTFNDSSGFEAWNLTGSQGALYVAQGGGNIEVFTP